MTKPDAASTVTPVLAWENEGGALPTTPRQPPRRLSDPAAEWRALVTLGAVVAVWGDLSVGFRRRIAAKAMVAMRRTTDNPLPRA